MGDDSSQHLAIVGQHHESNAHCTGQKKSSAHQEPNKKSTNTDTFTELNPSQPIGIELKCSHHQIQHFLVLTHQKRAVSRIELLNLLELDFTELGHLPRANEASVNPIKSPRWSTERKIQNLLRCKTKDHSNHCQIIPKQDEMNHQKNDKQKQSNSNQSKNIYNWSGGHQMLKKNCAHKRATKR